MGLQPIRNSQLIGAPRWCFHGKISELEVVTPCWNLTCRSDIIGYFSKTLVGSGSSFLGFFVFVLFVFRWGRGGNLENCCLQPSWLQWRSLMPVERVVVDIQRTHVAFSPFDPFSVYWFMELRVVVGKGGLFLHCKWRRKGLAKERNSFFLFFYFLLTAMTIKLFKEKAACAGFYSGIMSLVVFVFSTSLLLRGKGLSPNQGKPTKTFLQKWGTANWFLRFHWNEVP